MVGQAKKKATLAQFDRIVALLWSIWKTHNSIVFRNELPQAVVTLIRAKKASAEWRIRHKITTSIQPPNPPLSSPHKAAGWDRMGEAAGRIHQS